MKKIFILVALALLSTSLFAQKFPGLALTPQMGWNTWNKFQGNINEQLIKETADKMVELGLVDAGYVYLNIDDCWHGQRDANGFITENKEKFPSGMKALGDYIHSKGMKFGIYSDAGRQTCACFPGSSGHEFQDALVYARWGVDYLKYDWCHSKDLNSKGAYSLMRDALYAAGRPVLFSICEWGSTKPWLWAENVGHSWRTTGDISPAFKDGVNYGDWTALSVLDILDKQDTLRKYAGPGHWNDPDMLEVGNGMSVNEDRAHFTMWCMLAAPLILGNDLTNMSKETLDIIKNKAMIAVDQDSLGVQGLKYRDDGDIEYWFKPLSGGDWAMTVLNRGAEPYKCTINWKDFDFTDQLSGRSTGFGKTVYTYKNLWAPVPANAKEAKAAAKASAKALTLAPLTVTIPSHDVLSLRLSPKPVKK